VRSTLLASFVVIGFSCGDPGVDNGTGGGTSATGGGTSATGGGTSATGGGTSATGGGTANGWLHRPFTGSFRTANFFDHNVPKEFVDTNGVQTAYWGEQTTFIDGHSGYDFVMPEGTPLLSASDGVVTFASQETPFSCPLLGGSMVAANIVRVRTTPADGLTRLVEYVHLSRIDVTVGQQVTVAQQVGLSGNTGCSTGPHLHFEVDLPGSPKLIPVDPYGWTGAMPDPWPANGGAASTWLWAANEAPPLYREVIDDQSTNTGSWLTLTRVRWMGVHDELDANNEFVEIARDPAFAPASVSLTGYSLANHAGETIALPAVDLTAGAPMVRVHMGHGANTASDLYLNRNVPLWSNAGDCARLVFPNGNAWHEYFGGASCP
jgi:murein DD-endopeptidase MepM/ murein hydrolase activator NlpD